MERDLKVVRIQTAQPSRSYGGRIEEAMYAVDDGYVQLYDMHGMSMGPEHRRKLPPHLTTNEWAAKMLRETVGKGRSSFDRVLRYAPLKY
jgi:hypothetical protein